LVSRDQRAGFKGLRNTPQAHSPKDVSGEDRLRGALERATEVLALEAAGRQVDASSTWPFDLDASSTWPFDPDILRQLAAVMLPIVIALASDLIRRALAV